MQGAPRTNERRYVLQELIARGGFGEVWRGRLIGAEGFAKDVAIKILHEYSNPQQSDEFGRRLRDEARLLAMLRHRSIIHVDDLIRVDRRWAVVMEYVAGQDLAALIKQGPLPFRAVCEIAADVAAALNFVHSAADPDTSKPLGLIHRDIKPANILISMRGEVKVLDFGVAHARFEAREADTRSLSFGSPGYMAPERWDQDERPASDIYALGLVVCECLLGRSVGQPSVNQRRHDVTMAEVLSEVSGVGSGRGIATLEDVLRRMLQYDPDQRPSADEAEEVFRDLMAAAEGPWLKRWAQVQVTGSRPSSPPPSEAPSVEAEAEPGVATGGVHAAESMLQDVPTTLWIPVPVPKKAPSRRAVGVLTRVMRPRYIGLFAGIAALVLAVDVVLWLRLNASDEASDPALATVDPPADEGSPPAASDEGGADGFELRPSQPEPEPASASSSKSAPSAPSQAKEKGARVGSARAAQPTSSAQSAPVAQPTSKPAPVADPPAAAPPPTAPPEAPPTTGRVKIKGTVASLVLIDEAGDEHAPGELPPGEYSIRVTFDSGLTIKPKKVFEVEAGRTLTIVCDSSVENCR